MTNRTELHTLIDEIFAAPREDPETLPAEVHAVVNEYCDELAQILDAVHRDLLKAQQA